MPYPSSQWAPRGLNLTTKKFCFVFVIFSASFFSFLAFLSFFSLFPSSSRLFLSIDRFFPCCQALVLHQGKVCSGQGSCWFGCIMKKVDENVVNPFEEGMTVFGMHLTSKGLSWGENLCQKLESVNLNNIIGQNPSKVIDAFGDHVRKICEAVAEEWLNPFSDDVEDVDSNSSSEYGDRVSCKKYDDHNEGGNSTFTDKASIHSSLHMCQCANLEQKSVPKSTNSISTPLQHSKHSSPDLTTRAGDNVSDWNNVGPCTISVADWNDVGPCTISVADTQNLQPNAVKVNESGKVSVPLATSAKSYGIGLPRSKTMGSACDSNGVRPQYKQDALEPCQSVVDMEGSVIGFDTITVDDVIDMNTSAAEEFEHVGLDHWDDDVCKELALIKNQASKKISYKKKLRRAITSKFHTVKGKEHQTSSSKELVPGSSRSHAYDSDWELV